MVTLHSTVATLQSTVASVLQIPFYGTSEGSVLPNPDPLGHIFEVDPLLDIGTTFSSFPTPEF